MIKFRSHILRKLREHRPVEGGLIFEDLRYFVLQLAKKIHSYVHIKNKHVELEKEFKGN